MPKQAEPSVLSHPSVCFIIFAGHGMLNMKHCDLVMYRVAISKQTGAAWTPLRCSPGLYLIADNSVDSNGCISAEEASGN